MAGWMGTVRFRASSAIRRSVCSTAFAKSMDDRAMLAALKSDDAEQQRRGISSQPIFEIGQQRLFGFQSFEVLQRAIEAALKA